MNRNTALLVGGLILIILAYCCLLSSLVHAHEWYTNKKTPNGGGCCGGSDCAHIESGSVKEVQGGFIVTLTKAEMARIRPGLATVSMSYDGTTGTAVPYHNIYFDKVPEWGIVEFIPHQDAQPAEDGNYSACLGYSPTQMRGYGPARWIVCFFYPTNS